MTNLLDAARSLARFPSPATTAPILRVVPVRGASGAVITLAGEIDLSSADQVRAAVADCLREPPPTSLTLDLSAVTFCDCAGVRALEWARHRVRAAQVTFTLAGADARLRRTFTLAQADHLLKTCEPAHR